MKKFFVVFLALALMCGSVFAGGKKEGGVTFTIALSEDIAAVDPGVAWNYVTNQVTNQITEGLVTFDANNKVVPLLAKSWKQVDDVTYVYDVRDDVTFSDGSKMTMDDVLYSFERTKDPDGGTWFADWYADATFSVSGWQFTIKLAKPNAVFQYIPATGAGRVIKKAYHEKVGKDAFGTAAGGIVGTGPFMYEPNSWKSGQEIILKKNPNYWDKNVLSGNIVDTIVYKIIPEDTTRTIALQNGQVDFCVNINANMIDQLKTAKNLSMTIVPSFQLTTLAMNTQRAPFNDKNVRKAVSHALDIPKFCAAVIKDSGTPGTVLPFGEVLYGDNAQQWKQYVAASPKYDYDVAKAKAALAQSGYPNGFDCDLIVSEASIANDRALFIQEALKPLGINVNIRKMSGDEQDENQMGQVKDKDGKRDYDMIIGGWEPDYPDLDGAISVLLASGQAEGGYNSAAYSNPQVDMLLARQEAVTDPAKRFDAQKQLMDIVVDEVPYIVFDYSTRQSVLSKKYTGLAASPAWLWLLPVQNVRAAK